MDYVNLFFATFVIVIFIYLWQAENDNDDYTRR